MNSNIMTIIELLLITFFIHKSLHYVNSQSITYTVEFFNSTMTNDLLNLDNKEIGEISSNCTETFELFTEKVTNLTRCTLLNARPVRICMDCEEGMFATNKTYKKLQEEHSCKQYYFESDQIGITNIIYDQVLNLWKINNCENCYNHVKEAEEFFGISRELDKCMKQYNQSVTEVNNTCIMCLEHFIQLNHIYKDFVKNITEDGSGICMDIVDQMNITRHTWSNLDCLKFNSNIGFPIIITAVIVGIIPVLFYLLSKNVSILEDVKLVRPKRKSYASLQDSLPKD